ncbi:Sugar transport protein 5 [Abeliophyllum distichum]|uniref:Sugar transport protein 5 n=1 Tax=Abeliophyllum distichum TaxID=126358 RepID=A0ABD1SSY8_9LAMI
MAIGVSVLVDENGHNFNNKITASMIITCFVAASGGLIFGYDIGISCAFCLIFILCSVFSNASSHGLHIFTLCSWTSRFTTALGRRNIMVLGSCTFLAGVAINGAVENIAMLILGRILLGFGVGFTNQVTPGFRLLLVPLVGQNLSSFGL